MPGKYRAYPEYMDSGVEWLEAIPSHWDVRRTKAMFSLTRELVGKQSVDYQLLSLTLRGVVTRDISDGGGKIPAEFDTYQIVRPQNLVFCLFDIDETPRTIGLSSHNGMITGAYNVYRCLDACVPEYAYYYFMHIDSFKGLKPFYTGLRKVVRAETFSNIKMPAPGLLEQQKIANFLDHETAKIDTLIEKQQQLIKLLKEKRQAVISHAVTKGLNPNAKMRDSGVKWLGEVPEHWRVVPLKHLCYLLKDGTHLPPPRVDSGVPLLSVRNIINNKFILRDDDSNISEEDYRILCKPFIPKKRDVLLAIVGATLGKVAIVGDMPDFHIQRSLAIFRVNPALMTSEGLANIFGSTNFQSLLWENVGFSAQPGIYLGMLENFQLPVPPLSEQIEINEYCKLNAERIDYLIQKAEIAIGLIQERRAALISAAVTGKIDVRDWQPTNG